jgi:hypothetical protein
VYQPISVDSTADHAPATLAGVTSIYNRFDYAPETRKALKRWAEHVARLTSEDGKLERVA